MSGLAVLALIVTNERLDAPGAWAAGALLIGWGFIGAGLYAWGRRPDNRVGMLMAATASPGFAASGFSDLPLGVHARPGLRRASSSRSSMHLLLAFPSGELQSRWTGASSASATC